MSSSPHTFWVHSEPSIVKSTHKAQTVKPQCACSSWPRSLSQLCSWTCLSQSWERLLGKYKHLLLNLVSESESCLSLTMLGSSTSKRSSRARSTSLLLLHLSHLTLAQTLRSILWKSPNPFLMTSSAKCKHQWPKRLTASTSTPGSFSPTKRWLFRASSGKSRTLRGCMMTQLKLKLWKRNWLLRKELTWRCWTRRSRRSCWL